MVGPDGSKVTLVECRNLRLGKPFGEGDDAGINDAEREISVACLQLAAPGQISVRRRLDAVDPGQQIVEKDQPGLGREPAAAPVIELSEDERRHHEILVAAREQPCAALVIGIGRV